MKIALNILAMTTAVCAARTIAGPGSFGSGGTNVCGTNRFNGL